MQKKKQFLFAGQETCWMPMTHSSGSWVVGQAISGSYSIDNTSRKHTANVANIRKNTFFNWHITSVLAMIFTCSICVLKRNISNDNPFLSYNWPFQLSTFTTTASHNCVRYPILSAPEEKLEIVTICKENSKTNIYNLYVLLSSYNSIVEY